MDEEALVEAIGAALSSESDLYADAHASASKRPADLCETLLLHRLTKPIEDILKTAGPFQGGGGFLVANDNGYTGFHSGEAARALLERVRSGRPAIEAIQWLQRIVTIPKAAGYCALALRGIEINEAVHLGFDMELLPYEALPDSRTKEWIARPRDHSGYPGFFSSMLMFPPKVAILRRCEISPVFFSTSGEEPPQKADPLQNQRMLEDAMLALTLVGPSCPVPAGSWFTFEDPDIEATSVYGGVSAPFLEVLPWGFDPSIHLDSESVKEIVPMFLSAKDPLKTSLRLALRRFNQAMRRPPHGDRALDLAISLESILSDAPGDNTFKVSLRAGLLTNGSTNEKVKVRSLIRALYGIRSALAHDGVIPRDIKVTGSGKRSASDVVSESTEVCAALLKTILHRGTIPDWYKFELGSTSA